MVLVRVFKNSEITPASTDEHHEVRRQVPLRTVRNCVRLPRKHPQTPTFTGSHQEAFGGGKSLIPLREEVISHSVGERRGNRPSITRMPLRLGSISYGTTQVVVRGPHVLDRPDLGCGQSMTLAGLGGVEGV
jgi:hypothetical protein